MAWLALVSLGWLLIYSTTYYQPDLHTYAARQAVFIILGFCLQVFLSRSSLEYWLKVSPALYLGSLALLVLVLLVGVDVNGARRWLALGSLGALQPSEFLKFTLPLFQVHLLRKRRWGQALLALIFPTLLVLRQPDLGTAACYAVSAWGLFFLVGFDWRALLGGAAVSSWLMSQKLHEYQKERLLMFLDPEKDATGSGWNLIQAKIAVGSGGLHGLGLFDGLQKRLMYVPEQHTDFLFTVLAEEWGLFGTTLVILLFGLLLARGFRLARRAKNLEARWICALVSWSLGFQAVINMAMVIGLFPVTGVPLPLLSYGGTAMLSQCALLGLLQCEARRQFRDSQAQVRLQWALRG